MSDLDATTLHEVATSPRRRAIVRAIADLDRIDVAERSSAGRQTQSVDVASLAGMPAVAQAGLATGDARQVRMSLEHIHLPKLSDAGIVGWNRVDETVTPTARTEPAADALDAVAEVLGDD